MPSLAVSSKATASVPGRLDDSKRITTVATVSDTDCQGPGSRSRRELELDRIQDKKEQEQGGFRQEQSIQEEQDISEFRIHSFDGSFSYRQRPFIHYWPIRPT